MNNNLTKTIIITH